MPRPRTAFVVALCLPVLSSCAARGPVRTVRGPDAAVAPPAEGRRTRKEIDAGMAREKRREPHIPMLSEEEAHAAMPTLFKGRSMPTLARVGALQPKTMLAVLETAKAMRKEGGLHPKLLNDVFWEVSSANDCFY